ncbi:hypothetical protein QQ045_015417 [Rhodiola kirilowii]
MDLTSSTTTTVVNHSDASLPAPQNPNDQPQSIPPANPNPVHLHPTSQPYTYYPAPPAQEHQIQAQYYHYQQIHPQWLSTGAVAVAVAPSYPNWHYSQINALDQRGGVSAPSSLVEQYVPAPASWVNQYVPAIPNGTTTLTSPAVQSHKTGKGKWKRVSKQPKVIQFVHCDICKIDCNSNEILQQHKLGKKHLKNVSKMVKQVTPVAVTSNPMIGPAEIPMETKADAGQKSKRAASYQGDLETKRMKVVAGGASAAAVRVCTVCNVVCNSETVFNYHIAGQKHATSMKKYLALGAGKIHENNSAST